MPVATSVASRMPSLSVRATAPRRFATSRGICLGHIKRYATEARCERIGARPSSSSRNAEPVGTVERELAALRNYSEPARQGGPDDPRRRRPIALLLATWNIANLGAQERAREGLPAARRR